MKKAFIFILFFIFTTSLLADEPEYSYSLNENIFEHGWKIKNTSNLVGTERSAHEIVTLSKNGWILKCSLRYYPEDFYQRCWIP